MFGWLKGNAALKYDENRLPSEWVDQMSQRSQFTPDLWELEQKWFHNVFIYDGLMKHHRDDHLMNGYAIGLGSCFTKDESYVMWKKKLGKETFPFALQTTEDMKFGNSTFLGEPHKISGELYTMRPGQILKLDNHLANTVLFERKRVQITYNYRLKDGRNAISEPMSTTLEAWMYVGSLDFWADQITHKPLFDQVKVYTQNDSSDHELHKYYFYNEKLESSSR